jgi:hypothetical protein
VPTIADPVLDLDNHGRLDVKQLTVNGPNDVTVALTNLTLRDTALQRVDFLDGSLIFDGASPQGRYAPDLEASQVARLYYTALGRAPEFAGAYGWVNQMETQNQSVRDIAPGFINSREFAERYGTNTTDEQFVSLLYRNILGRDAEPAGAKGWTDLLANRAMTRTDVVVGTSESFEHKAIRFDAIEANGIRFFGDPFL